MLSLVVQINSERCCISCKRRRKHNPQNDVEHASRIAASINDLFNVIGLERLILVWETDGGTITLPPCMLKSFVVWKKRFLQPERAIGTERRIANTAMMKYDTPLERRTKKGTRSGCYRMK